jgi:hypothetical protein
MRVTAAATQAALSYYWGALVQLPSAVRITILQLRLSGSIRSCGTGMPHRTTPDVVALPVPCYRASHDRGGGVTYNDTTRGV